MNEKLKKEIFAYMDMLRITGQCNMLEAPKIIAFEFELSKKEARELFIEWTQTFDKEEVQ